MTPGKLPLKDIQKIIRDGSDIMVESNRIGSDFSWHDGSSSRLILKIEPMVYYGFLNPRENAFLSLLFPLNDFLVSGTTPSLALIDFEQPKGSGKEYFDYVSSMFSELRWENIKVASGHSGNYGNLTYGVCGSMALIGFGRPLFDYRRITSSDSFYVMGKLGYEYLYFARKKVGREISARDLSVRNKMDVILGMRDMVHYVHDLSEGGLIRGLKELSSLTGSGFNLNSAKARPLIPRSLIDLETRIFSASSSGAVVAAVGTPKKKEFERELEREGMEYYEIERRDRGIKVDGKPGEEGDAISSII